MHDTRENEGEHRDALAAPTIAALALCFRHVGGGRMRGVIRRRVHAERSREALRAAHGERFAAPEGRDVNHLRQFREAQAPGVASSRSSNQNVDP